MQKESLDDILTPHELAALVHASPRTIIRWRSEGTGPTYVRAGRRVLYRRRDVVEWLERHKTVPARECA
jgi:excisionase family DNA binding protein